MTIVATIVRTIGVPICAILLLLTYYEGVPVLRDIAYADRIPVVRELITGRVATQAAKAAEAARKGYVQEARATAAEARAAELQRQVDAGQVVIASYQEIAKNAKVAEQAATDKAEKQINDYETILRNAGRACTFNADDIRMLESQ